MYKEIQGDLLIMDDHIRAHQCNVITSSENCSGIAKYIFEKYPDTAKVNNDYLQMIAQNKWKGLGHYSYDSNDKIYNIYSQCAPGIPSNIGIDTFECRLQYLRQALTNINSKNKGEKIALPLIASGLAKQADFGITDDLKYYQKYIRPIVLESLPDMDVTVVYL